jgi:hypothetical protein
MWLASWYVRDHKIKNSVIDTVFQFSKISAHNTSHFSFIHVSFPYFRGSVEATRQAHNLIAALIKDPDVDILQLLPKSSKLAVVSMSSWDKSSAVVSFSIIDIPRPDSDSGFKNPRINFTAVPCYDIQKSAGHFIQI